MARHHQEQESVAVAVAASAAEAELIQMTLAAHGIAASTAVPDPAHPSLNFVQGLRVYVALDDAEDARALLGEDPA